MAAAKVKAEKLKAEKLKAEKLKAVRLENESKLFNLLNTLTIPSTRLSIEVLPHYKTSLENISQKLFNDRLINDKEKIKLIKNLYNLKMYTINKIQINNFKSKCLVLLYYIRNDIELSQLTDTQLIQKLIDIEKNNLDEYEYSIDSIIDNIRDNIPLNETLINQIKTELLIESLYINNIDTTHAFEDCFDYDRCIQLGAGGNLQDYNQNGGGDSTFKSIDDIKKFKDNNKKISYLLENGIDSTHDFASKDSQIQSEELPAKKEVFNLFWPSTPTTISIDKKIRNVFDTFNDCVTQDMIKNNDKFKYVYDEDKSFKFKLKTSISKTKVNSWPFSSGWERYATLYYTQGLDADKHFGHDIYKKCSSDDKVLIVSQDSKGGSSGLLNLLGNVLFLPETIKTSVDYHLKNDNNDSKRKALIEQLEEITDYSLEKEKDDILKHLIVNPIKKYQANKLGVNFLSDMNRFYWTNPSQLIDAAGSSDKNIDELYNELKDFSEHFKRKATNPSAKYSLELKQLESSSTGSSSTGSSSKKSSKKISPYQSFNELLSNTTFTYDNGNSAFDALKQVTLKGIIELDETNYGKF